MDTASAAADSASQQQSHIIDLTGPDEVQDDVAWSHPPRLERRAEQLRALHGELRAAPYAGALSNVIDLESPPIQRISTRAETARIRSDNTNEAVEDPELEITGWNHREQNRHNEFNLFNGGPAPHQQNSQDHNRTNHRESFMPGASPSAIPINPLPPIRNFPTDPPRMSLPRESALYNHFMSSHLLSAVLKFASTIICSECM